MSDLLTRLLEAGTPPALVAEVAKELARAEVAKEAIDQRRAKDRERQQRKRGNVTSRDTADVTKNEPEKIEASYIVTPVSPKGDTAPTGAKRNRGTKISEDWTPPSPSELGPDFRPLAEQWTETNYRTEAAAFRSYWLAETGVKASKSNWKRAWENRIAQIHSKVMRDQRFARPPPLAGANDLVSSILGKQQAHAP